MTREGRESGVLEGEGGERVCHLGFEPKSSTSSPSHVLKYFLIFIPFLSYLSNFLKIPNLALNTLTN